MVVWEQHFAPVRAMAFVVAGAEQFYAMAGSRTAIGPHTTEATAYHHADAMDLLFRGCPAHQRGCAAQAAMGVM